MKKAALPAYILLVIGFLACLQKNAVISGLIAVTPCFSTTDNIQFAGFTSAGNHTIWVLPARIASSSRRAAQMTSFYFMPSKSYTSYCKTVYRCAQEANQ